MRKDGLEKQAVSQYSPVGITVQAYEWAVEDSSFGEALEQKNMSEEFLRYALLALVPTSR